MHRQVEKSSLENGINLQREEEEVETKEHLTKSRCVFPSQDLMVDFTFFAE